MASRQTYIRLKPAAGLASLLLPERLVWAVVLLGALLRIYRYSSLSLWVDEGLTLEFSRLPWDTVLGLHGAYETHPPLYFALVKAASMFAPELTAGRLVSVVAGILTLSLLYILAAPLIGRRGALAAASVLAISPLHIWYSQEARPYALSMLFVCASYMALVKFYRSAGRPDRRDHLWAAFYGLMVLLAVYTEYSVIYALAPQAMLLVYLLIKQGKRALWLWGAGLAAVVGFLPWLPQLLGTVHNFADAQAGYLSVSLPKMWTSVLSVVGIGGHSSYFAGTTAAPWDGWPPWHAIMLLAILPAVVLGLLALKKQGTLAISTTVGLLAGTIAVGAFISVFRAGYAERTVLYALLGWALLAGAASVVAGKIARPVAWASLAVTIVLSLMTVRAIYDGGDKQHWRDLAQDSTAALRSGTPLLLYPTVTGVLVDAYQPGTLEHAANIGDFSDLPGFARPDLGVKSLWLAYIEAGGIDRLREQLASRGYTRTAQSDYGNSMYLDVYTYEAAGETR
ncbi:MAG: glycosyltransferase family 39 protein [Chloroflexota bacterium]